MTTSTVLMPPFAILAGGLATRLGEVVRTIPKALVPIAGEPFIAHQLRLLRREGVRRVVLCTGHLSDQIEAYVGKGSAFGVDVAFSRDGPKLLGTGGALRQAMPLLGDEFAVMYGDSYLDTPFAPVVARFRESGCRALMTVYHNEGRFDQSNVAFSNGMVTRYDKQQTDDMEYIDYGMSLLRSDVLRDWPEQDPFDLSSVLRTLATQGQLAGFEVPDRFYEIGSHAGIADTEAYLSRSRPDGT